MRTWVIILVVFVLLGGGWFLIKADQGKGIVLQGATKSESARKQAPEAVSDSKQIVNSHDGITEVSLPNAVKIVNKPSIEVLKEYRKRSDELEKQTATFNSLPVIRIGDTSVNVELAYTYERQKQGLDGIDSMPKDQGMLYVFQMDDPDRVFGTQQMKFPLDLMWANSDFKIVHITKNAPVGYSGDLKSLWPARYVLEVNAGFVDEHHIVVGDSLDLGTVPH